MSEGNGTINAIYRYPVKGLSPERLERARLAVGETIAGDRRYAIENGPSGFDPASPGYIFKSHFLMLMKNERLARLRSRMEDDDRVLIVEADSGEAVRGDLATEQGRAAIERFFAQFCADELRGPPKVLQAVGHSFSDLSAKVVSIINLASVAALEEVVGAPVDPLRFRGNLYVGGWPAWREFDFLDRELAAGGARLKVVKRIQRCAATNVDPVTGMRNLQIPRTLAQTYGHMDCGIYAKVVAGGEVTPGADIRPA